MPILTTEPSGTSLSCMWTIHTNAQSMSTIFVHCLHECNRALVFFACWNDVDVNTKNMQYCYEIANPCPHVYIFMYGAMHGIDRSCTKYYNT